MSGVALSGLNATPRWAPALWGLTVATVLILAAYWDTAASMAATWLRSETYMHGLVIVPMAAVIAWRKRGEVAAIPPKPSLAGVAMLGAASGGWLLGDAANVLLAQQLALTATAPGLVVAFLGPQVGRVLAFPLAYVFFAVPFGESLVPHLQDVTAAIAVKAISMSGIPVYWEGRFISIPGGDFEVARACSGIRYLIASLALGCLYAYVAFSSLRRRILFIALCALVPIAANGLRAYGIILLAYLTDMHLAVGVDHIIYGWLFFGLVMLLIFWLGSFWRERPVQRAAPVREIQTSRGGRGVSRALVGAAGLAAALCGAAAGAWLEEREGQDPQAPFALALIPGPGGWEGPLTATTAWSPALQEAQAMVKGTYSSGTTTVDAVAAYFARERQGAELVSEANAVYDSKAWRRLEEGGKTLRLGQASLDVHETLVRSRGENRIIWRWYQIGDFRCANPIVAKLAQAWHYLRSGRREGMLLMVSTSFVGERDRAEEMLSAFLTDVWEQANDNAGKLTTFAVPAKLEGHARIKG